MSPSKCGAITLRAGRVYWWRPLSAVLTADKIAPCDADTSRDKCTVNRELLGLERGRRQLRNLYVLVGHGAGQWRKDIHTGFVGKPVGMRILVTHRRRWKNNIEAIAEKWDGRVWTGLNWLRIGASGGLL